MQASVELPQRGGLGRELLHALVGWSVIGASAGALIAAISIRMNSSLQGPGQAGPFLGLVSVTYALLFAIAGLAVGLAGHFLGRSRASLFTHALAAIVGFAGFLCGQFLIGALSWRDETRPSNILGALALGFVLAVAWRLVCGRLDLKLSRGMVGLLVLANAAFAFVSVSHGSQTVLAASKASAPALEVARSSQGELPRVMLIGVDGADWARLTPLMEAGRLPNFARLCKDAYAAPLATILPAWSPIVWTTIATGVREDVHGVIDFTEVELPGLGRGVQRSYSKYRAEALLPHDVGLIAMFDVLVHFAHFNEVPVSSTQRRQKALWNILGEQGVKSAFVRWWATWPAEKIDGWLLSDNDPLMQAFAAVEVEQDIVNPTSANMTWPVELVDELLPLIPEDGAIVASREEAASKLLSDPIFAGVNPDEYKIIHDHSDWLKVFEVILRGDQFATRTAIKLWREKQVPMLGVYLRAIDNLSHRFGKFTGVADRAYEFMDVRLGKLLDACDANTTVVLVSDHGWCYTQGKDFGHHQGQPGVIIVKGPGIAPTKQDLKPSVLDIAPTILALYGLPPSHDMTGKPLIELFATGTAAAVPRERIASYGEYRPVWTIASGREDAGRKQTVDLLRKLGYL